MSERPTVLSRETLVPVGVVLLLVGGIISGIIWIMNVRTTSETALQKSEETAQRQARVEADIESLKQQILQSIDRMARMETKIDIILESVKKN